MKNELNDLLDQPKELETLYRNNKVQFKQAFLDLYPLIKDKPQAEFWLHRLNYEGDEIQWGSKRELIFVLIAAVVAGLIAKMPAYTGI